jgi:hypothetical protein
LNELSKCVRAESLCRSGAVARDIRRCCPGMKKNADGSLTLYIQKDSPGKAKEANWLPAPNDTIYLILRLYWPKDTSPSVLPAGEGTWKPPGIVPSK